MCFLWGDILHRRIFDAIDKKAKEIGLWGLEKRGKIGYSGNSLIIRIPKKVVDFMELKKGANIIIKPEGKKSWSWR